MWIFRTVFQQNAHFHRTVYRLHFTVGNILLQTHHVGSGLGKVDIHRIGLLDGRQYGTVVRADQRAFGNFGLSDITRNRRGNARVTDIDLRGFNRSFG